MAEPELIAAVRANDRAAVLSLLETGTDPNQQDEQGWTALCFAAGMGHEDIVTSLFDHGADVFRTGNDQRTPYLIALAARRLDVARMLSDAEERADGDIEGRSSRQAEHRPYCRAYLIDQLRRFPGWSEPTAAAAASDAAANGGRPQATDANVVFIHRDFTVTRSLWLGEDIVFDAVTPAWQQFCADVLGFRPPNDFDLVTPEG
jgi:ankyrin repeat protein